MWLGAAFLFVFGWRLPGDEVGKEGGIGGGQVLLERYGMTETGVIASTGWENDKRVKRGTLATLSPEPKFDFGMKS